MKKITLALLALSWLLVSSCSKVEENPVGVQGQIKVHEPGWNEGSSPEFHGKILAMKNFVSSDCRDCHGSDLNGGLVQVSCRTCHVNYPHPDGWAGTSSGSHVAFIKITHYDITSCRDCHGQDYATVKTDNSCLTCHTQTGGPEACNTCHGNKSGDPAVLANVVPPRGLDGETSPTEPAVGAHQVHLAYYDFLTTPVACQECHVVPATYSTTGHIGDDDNADLIFGPIATTVSSDGTRKPAPTYSREAASCDNTYCHGNWALPKSKSANDFIFVEDTIEGNVASPTWTDSTSVSCGTCHDLPPKGHFPHVLTSCTICHSSVIDVNGNIIDPKKHINGKINVFGQEYPMF